MRPLPRFQPDSAALSGLLACALAVSAPAAAEPAAPQTLPRLIVRETLPLPERERSNEEARQEIERIPGGVAQVDDARIERTRAASLEDVLGFVPGVLVRSRGQSEEPQISIRGSGLRGNFHTRGVNVWLDGLPFQNADGFSDVESFEFLAAKRVEVYKGGSSLRQGGDMLGGAIQIVTRTGADAERVRLRSEGGSYGYLKSFASTGGVSGPWDGYLALSHTQGHGYREHAEQDRQRVYASLAREFEGGARLRVDVNAVRNRQDLPGALTRAELHDDPRQADPASVAQDAARDFEYGRAALGLDVPLSARLRLEAVAQLNHQDLWHPLPFGIIDNRTWNATSELRLVSDSDLLGRANFVRAGAQAAYTGQPQEIHANESGQQGPAFEDQEGRAWNGAVYVTDELALGERLSLLAGARAVFAKRELDDHDQDDSFFDPRPDDDDSEDWVELIPSLGALWRVTPELQIYGNLARGWEPPLLLELTAPGNLGGDLSDLHPQRAWQLEAGARGRHERLSFDVAVYDVELRDEIRNLNVDPTGLGFFTIPRYENIDRSRHWGVEVYGDLLLGRNLVGALGLAGDDELHLATAWTFSRFRYVDDEVFGNNDLPGAPRHFVRSELLYRHASGFWIAPNLEWTARHYYVDSANTKQTSAYALFNLRLGYDHAPTGLSGFLELRNAFDREHVSAVVVDSADGRSFEPGDGRGIYVGMEWRWL